MLGQATSLADVLPDRLFQRVLALAVGAAVLMLLASHFVLERANSRQTALDDTALFIARQTVSARGLLIDLDRMIARPPSTGRAGAALELRRDLAAFVARTEAIAEKSARDAVPPRFGLSATGALNPQAWRLDWSRAPEAPLPELRDLVATEILPKLDLVSQEAADAASRAHGDTGRTTVALVSAQTLAWLLLVIGLTLAIRRTQRRWIADVRAVETDTRFRLLHDPLSQMPNITYLNAYLARLIARMERTDGQVAVFRVDLDKYNILRRTIGQRLSDEILRIAARRIAKDLRRSDFAAHLGRDDFVIVASGLADMSDVTRIAQRIQSSLKKAFAIEGGTRRITCSIGVTLLTDDIADPDRVLANAEIALTEAQASGYGQIRYFRESQRHEVERRERMFTELMTGLEKSQLAPHFQPQVDARTGALLGFEALIRWRHPRHGLLAPAAFLEFAEQTDLGERIGEIVLTHSLAAIRAWDAAGFHVPKVGINFAMAQLRDPRMIEKIKWEVERFDIDPARLAIEVLETVLIKSDSDLVVRNLQGLASAGFRIELDDFGTGHASIANLRRFRVDSIKIDGCFIFEIEHNREQQQITASMIALARALGIGTLAEGVETAGARATLAHLGCDGCQGHLIAMPMSLAETLDWLAAYRDADPTLRCGKGPVPGDPNTP